MFPEDRAAGNDPLTSVTDLSPIAFWRFSNNLDDTAVVGPYDLVKVAGTEDYGEDTYLDRLYGVFDESTYYSAVGYAGVLGSNPRAVSCWVKFDTAKSMVICTWGTVVAGERWTFRIDASGAIRVEIGGGSNTGTKDLSDGEWHHVVCSLEAGDTDVNQVIHYVDGEVDPVSSSNSKAVNTTSDADVIVGARESGTVLFDGIIDELAIFNGLTPANVTSLYENGLRDYDETEVWDEETKEWYADTTATGKQRLPQAGGRTKNFLVALSDQGKVYFGEV